MFSQIANDEFRVLHCLLPAKRDSHVIDRLRSENNISDGLCANNPFSKLVYSFCVNQPAVAVLNLVLHECVYVCLIQPLPAKD